MTELRRLNLSRSGPKQPRVQASLLELKKDSDAQGEARAPARPPRPPAGAHHSLAAGAAEPGGPVCAPRLTPHTGPGRSQSRWQSEVVLAGFERVHEPGATPGPALAGVAIAAAAEQGLALPLNETSDLCDERNK